MQKHCENPTYNDMVEVQTWDPYKTVQCDNNFGPPHNVLSPYIKQSQQ